MPKGKRRKICKRTKKKPTHKRRRKHWQKPKRKPRQPNILKATSDMTKFAVKGLVGASLISSVGATMKNATKK